MLVSICIATFHRPEGLARLLEGLEHQRFSSRQDVDIEIVVVDNDSEGSAAEVAARASHTTKWVLKYVIEPTQGISYARNRGVAESNPASDFLAFIDDDEVPDPDWIDEMLLVQVRERADVVHGEVIPFYMEGVPDWIVDGGFFVESPFFEDNSGSGRLNTAATNCTLVRSAVLEKYDPPFDLAFGLTGGEDDFLFRTLYADGKVLVHAPNAKVTEWIPAHRANSKWLLKSAYRKGNTFTLTHLKLNKSFGARLERVSKAAVRITQGTVETIIHVLKRDDLWVLGAQKVALGSGTLVGVFGKSLYKAYAKPRGL